ncbi:MULTISPECIES: TetR/AcrR family transcriptional regulator [Streptomyces]|uniref:TetR/AcrR family transcriptional regulator n=1 Tax=Streptomyces TaxID=1883 RepID=UPI000997F784|nr:TetR family transcriptional regulator [Streptomyces sp. SID5926]NEC40868.1 helix-turn-helix transcriptional regulator [Streptomyces sp. SID8016]NEC64706.1 helix-turn-helix transcriptional regulator [Streptomyces sp. SID9727]
MSPSCSACAKRSTPPRPAPSWVTLIEEGGYEAFTIAALCEKAQVPPRALYDRTSSKDALFLAVYEHGIARIAAGHRVLTAPDPWRNLATDQLITAVVTELTALFRQHAAFLKPVVLLSGAHPEVLRRGRAHVQAHGDAFTARLLTIRPHPPPGPGSRRTAVLRHGLLRLRRSAHRTRPRLRHRTRGPRRLHHLPRPERHPHPLSRLLKPPTGDKLASGT